MGKNKSIGLPGGPNQIIVDPKGQWNHPGKNTRIEGNHITMQDVEYPVWAQPNVGPGTMMMPGSEHYFKNADYVDEFPMAQDGTEIPDEAAVPENSFLYDIETLINKSLGNIDKKARDFSESEDEMANIDNMRHASGGRYAAEAIQQKVRDLPYVGGLLDFVGVDKAAGFIGANAMGMGHELRTIFGGDERPFLTKLQEMGEDTFNNYVGSIVGSLNIDDSKKDEVIRYLSYNNLLPDGYVATEEGKKEGMSKDVYFKDAEGKRRTPEYQLGGVPSQTLMPLASLVSPPNLVRGVTPLPQNASQLIFNKLTGYDKYSFEDSTYHANEQLKRSVLNAIKRTGQTKGGTQYIDYGPEIEKDLDGLNMSSIDMLAGSLLSPELAAATTFGRVSYEQDPNTGDITIYDSYDFSSTPQKNTVYSKIRGLVSDGEKGKSRVVGVFNPKDETSLSKKVMENVLNPIDALNIKYGDIKSVTDIPSNLYKKLKEYLPTPQDVMELGKYLPTFQDAGSTSTPTKQIEFMTNWANSPMHNQMLNASSSSEKFKNKVKVARSNFDNVNIVDEEVDGFLGQYINGQVTMNPSAMEEYVIGNGYDSVLVHELSHFTDDGNPDNKGYFNASNIPLSDRRLIKKYGKQGIKRLKEDEKELNELLKSEGLTPNDKEVIQERIDRARYLNRDTETRSRINATRYFYEEDEDFGRSSERNIDKNLPSIFDSKVTPEMIEIMKKSGQYKQLQEIYTDDQILEMFNTISDSKTPERSFNVLNARYGKELPTAQKGKSIITALLKKAKEWAPSVFGKIDNVAKNSDNVVKAVSNTSKKGLYEMLPIRQLESPTNYGSLKIDDGTVQNALDMLKAQGKYADDVGYDIKDLVGENVQYLGNQAGRTIVNVPLPNGKSQLFYKSTDLAGKGTEGLWQPYAGHATVLDMPSKKGPVLAEDWFIKDIGYKNWYDSKSFRDIAGNLDRIAAEQGWDMSEQILKSKLKYGGDLPQAQGGKAIIKGILKKADEFIPTVKNYFKSVDDFEFKNLPSIEEKQFMKVVDGEFDVVEYDHLIPTQQEISDIAKATRKRLLSDKFIKNNMEATGRSKDEITGYIDDYIKEFENSTLAFDKTPKGAAGLYTRGKITIDPRNPHLTKENVLGTLEHEIEHMFSNVGQHGSDLYRHPKLRLVDRTGMPDQDIVENMGQAFEQQVRFRKALGWLEKNAGLKAGDNVTDEQVEKLTDAIANWSKEQGKDFRGTGANFDIQHLFTSLDAEQFLKPGQYLMPNAPRTANLKNSNVRKAIKDILNKTYMAAPVMGGAYTVKELQESGQLPIKQKGGPSGYNPYFDIDDKSKQRREKLNTALSTVVANSDNDSNLEALLLMTAAMENSFGGNSDAYGRNYTRGPMSIDDAAYNDLFDPRGENNRYTAQQKKMFDWLSSMGLDPTNMNNVLKAGDELAGMATARMQYARSPESLPSSQDPNAMYDYYMKFYNKTNADHKERFMGNYNAFIKPNLKTGGESNPYSRYKTYVNGGFVGSNEDKKNYDKLNRINYGEAKALGMTPANYIMTEISKRS